MRQMAPCFIWLAPVTLVTAKVVLSLDVTMGDTVRVGLRSMILTAPLVLMA